MAVLLMGRSSYLLHTDFIRLEGWCKQVRAVFDGEVPYMVGSATQRPDFRDVDLRLILPDRIFDRRFKRPEKLHWTNMAVSVWGQRETGLPVDFQIQRQTEANAEYGGHFRNPMGLRTPASYVTC